MDSRILTLFVDVARLDTLGELLELAQLALSLTYESTTRPHLDYDLCPGMQGR